MAGFLFRLETVDGSPAQPSSLESAVPNWAPGDMITLSRSRQLRVVELRDDDADRPPLLIVEDVAEGATSDAA
jgi:hypothetical protein